MPTRGFGPFANAAWICNRQGLARRALSRFTGPHLEKAIHPERVAEAAANHVCCRTRLGNGRSLETVCRASGSAWNSTHSNSRNHARRRRFVPRMDPRRTANINRVGLQCDAGSSRSAQGFLRKSRSLGKLRAEWPVPPRSTTLDLIVIGKGGAPELPGRLEVTATPSFDVRRARCYASELTENYDRSYFFIL